MSKLVRLSISLNPNPPGDVTILEEYLDDEWEYIPLSYEELGEYLVAKVGYMVGQQERIVGKDN